MKQNDGNSSIRRTQVKKDQVYLFWLLMCLKMNLVINYRNLTDYWESFFSKYLIFLAVLSNGWHYSIPPWLMAGNRSSVDYFRPAVFFMDTAYFVYIINIIQRTYIIFEDEFSFAYFANRVVSDLSYSAKTLVIQ